MKPNETLEVCRTLLVKERIKGGRCARFAFTFHWDHKPDILSKPFVIPDSDKPDRLIKCSGVQKMSPQPGGTFRLSQAAGLLEYLQSTRE